MEKKFIDVDNIFDIPQISGYDGHIFSLDCYDVNDKTQCYSLIVNEDIEINITINSGETLIKPHNTLFCIVTQDNIEYFDLVVRDTMDYSRIHDAHCYRPLVDKSDKNYETIR